MPEVKPIIINYREGKIKVAEAGITAEEVRVSSGEKLYSGILPDILLYLQQETELTRGTLIHVLKECGRLSEFKANPQLFMDEVVKVIKNVLHQLMINGIKYEKIDEEWSMTLFENDEIISYLNNRLDVQKSIYDAIVYDSEVEKRFAEELDKREDIKLFVKLPNWFKIETPIGTYNPDWAIIKTDGEALYLIRETKANKDFLKLRTSEAEKIRCGFRHFETLNVDYDVVTSAGEV
jgi:type III restriction enzyme